MKLLYFSGTYCPSIGGAEISIHSLLKRLKKEQGLDIKVLTDKKYSNEKSRHIYDEIEVIGATHEQREQALNEIINDYKPDFLLTQLLWSDVGLRISKENNIKSILRVCKIPFNLNIAENSIYSPSKIMVVSEPVKEYVYDNWGRTAYISKPIVELTRTSQGYKFENEYILMFNNLVRKGADVFAKTANILPNKKFAIVPGWDMLKKDDKFDETKLKNMCESLGLTYTGQQPTSVNDFPNNVEILKPDFNVQNIYSKTKILCIPSIWQETFGRVAIECMLSQVPVIGSAVGGLKQIVTQGGIVIEDYKNPNAWAEQIQLLEHKDKYDACVNKGNDYLKNFYNPKQIAYEFKSWLEND